MTTKRIILASALAIAFLVVGAPSCQPETPMTIRATPRTTKPVCGASEYVTGNVNPDDATSTVTIQRTIGGKWVDWDWYPKADSTRKSKLVGSVLSGQFKILYMAPKEKTTVHMRVRSSKGQYVSPGFYVSTSGACA